MQQERRAGEYLLQRRLGSGAMGEVWLGWHERSEQRVAVKLFRELPALRGRARRFFDRERRVVGRLCHPNIVSLEDVGHDYLVMAYVDGPNLAQRVQAGIEPAQALRITLQIASALAHAHASGVVHRDVKPGNILLDESGTAFLADFGLALFTDDGDLEARTIRAGTPGYMAPEQIAGQPTGPAADQYALARTFIEMLAAGHVSLDVDSALAALPDDLPRELLPVLRRACEREPGARWPSMRAFAAELERFDLAGRAAPVRLAPEVRVRAPFGWCGGARSTSRVSHDVARADHSLAALEASGLISRPAAQAFRDSSGYRDFAWSLYAHTTRLGSASDSTVLARARDVVVLIHGMLCSRETWHHIAANVCRDHPEAVVLVPDVLGCGESPFDEQAADDRLTPRALVETLLLWLELLGVRELPTVLCGHSAAATALLSVSDELLGERTSRVAVTPVFPEHDRSMRLGLRSIALVLERLGERRSLRRLLGEALVGHGPGVGRYTEAERDRMLQNFLRVPPRAFARFARSLAAARPEPNDRLDRCQVVVCEDDHVAPPERVQAALDALGVPRRSLRRLAAGGHNPQLELAEHPEWTLRNVEVLTGVVESMLLSAREGSPSSTVLASTVTPDVGASSGAELGAARAG